MNEPIQNITDKSVRLTSDSGSSFLLGSGAVTECYQKDSLFNNAMNNNRIRYYDDSDTAEPETFVEINPVEIDEGDDSVEIDEDDELKEGEPLEDEETEVELDFDEESLEKATEAYSSGEPSEDSEPNSLSGLSESIVNALADGGFETEDDVRDASNEELLELDGIGESRLETIRDVVS